MTAAAEVRELLTRHGLRARHALGQHFLIDERVYDRIVAEVQAAPDDWIVEIGAGLGTLTRRLCAVVPRGRVVALERDPRLHAVLGAELPGDLPLERWLGDAVRFDLDALASRAQRRLLVAGNLPYQISSPILARLEESRRVVTRAVIMLQREVAERLVAAPGTDGYGGLSVMLAQHFDVSLVRRVGPRAFLPPPRVDSAVVRLEARASARVVVADEGHLGRVVRAAFGQRRKTLRNALQVAASREAVAIALTAAAIDGQRRGETLSLAEFARLADVLGPAAGWAPSTTPGPEAA
jgi:16S rRNA (adenine1518-N6/adenine1519-N6)-dimethyltransferase